LSSSEPAGATVRKALSAATAEQRLRIVASLIRTTRDWDLAEDAFADAAERALLTWPRDGVPRNPAAWLTTTAHRRALDVIRRSGTERTKLAELGAQEEIDRQGGEETVDHGVLTDDRLRLVFTCCHPALAMEARVALTLKVVAGLTTAEVARMFLVPEPTMSQRLLRAKKRIANAGIPYKVPGAADLPERLDGVLAVVYLVFTQGYAGAAAPELAEEAIRLGRLLVELMPGEDETTAVLALMLAQHARRDARLVDGELVTLEHQDRSLWDRAAVDEALALTMPHGRVPGPYRLQAELALTHLRAAGPGDTDWRRIVRLYDRLLDLQPSPVVSLNRAIAVGMAESPALGLLALDDLAAHPALQGLHLLPAARADLLARAGRTEEAVAELRRAVALAPTEHERRQLDRRIAELGTGAERSP
jgi:RNA polymerase sigma-70 factor, ECF subfamily